MCFSLVSINKTFLKIKATLDIALFFHLHYFFFKLSFIPNNLSIFTPDNRTFTTILCRISNNRLPTTVFW
ncbi:hypothetical protein BSCG_00021 [Bacteroides sp. 2_2_4]|nr:hypothetical protein BSCG_00021 [Bacteroides sp. 2_2_4]